MSPHLIQLRAAWTACQPAPDSPPDPRLDGFDPTAFPARFSAPGSARLLRHFNSPFRLDPADRVCLLLVVQGELRGAWLGATPLEFSPLATDQFPPGTLTQAGQRAWRAELTPLLQRRNQLVIDLAGPPHGTTGEFSLDQAQIEIYSPSEKPSSLPAS